MNIPRPSDQELRGMTVNERLVMCGVFDTWERAARGRKREEMITVLRGVAMSEEQSIETTDAVLKSPRMYGF